MTMDERMVYIDTICFMIKDILKERMQDFATDSVKITTTWKKDRMPDIFVEYQCSESYPVMPSEESEDKPE